MKIYKIIAWGLLFAIVAIQFFSTERNQSSVAPKIEFLLVNNPPQNIRTILQESCYDCHSNNTDYPWYSNIQPAAWFLEDHIKNAKDELNFNLWNELSDRRKSSKLK